MRTRNILAVMALIMLSACAEIELASHVAKQFPIPDEKKPTGYYKVGTPYKIKGQWYRPKERFNYTQTGMASWYGPNFHGKQTANGEIFDMYEMTAAHKTLQMPSMVKVTNLENGREVVVRINDRGPYAKGRIIDLSKRAADELGFKGQGTARVKIEVIPEASRRVAMMAQDGQSTRGTELAYNRRIPQYERQPIRQALNSVPAPAAKPTPTQPSATGIYVQAGAFGNQASAQRFASTLDSFAKTNVHLASPEAGSLYKVRLGPFADRKSAEVIMAALHQNGQGQAFLVTNR